MKIVGPCRFIFKTLVFLIIYQAQVFAQKSCEAYLLSQVSEFEVISEAFLQQATDSSSSIKLTMALYSTNTPLVERLEGAVRDQYFFVAAIAAEQGVLRPFLANLLGRYPALKEFSLGLNWSEIDNLMPADINYFREVELQGGTRLEALALVDLQNLDEVANILARRLDNFKLEKLIRRTSIPISSVDFNQPYVGIAKSFLAQAVANDKLAEVYLAVRTFFKDHNFILPESEQEALNQF